MKLTLVKIKNTGWTLFGFDDFIIQLTLMCLYFQESETKLPFTTEKLNMYKRLLKLKSRFEAIDQMNRNYLMNQMKQMSQMSQSSN